MSWIDEEDKRCLLCNSDDLSIYFDVVTLCDRYECNCCGYDDVLWYPDDKYDWLQQEVIPYEANHL